MVVAKMYKELDDQHKRLLKVCWYTGGLNDIQSSREMTDSRVAPGKDQNRPINATAKKRNCHGKSFQTALADEG